MNRLASAGLPGPQARPSRRSRAPTGPERLARSSCVHTDWTTIPLKQREQALQELVQPRRRDWQPAMREHALNALAGALATSQHEPPLSQHRYEQTRRVPVHRLPSSLRPRAMAPRATTAQTGLEVEVLGPGGPVRRSPPHGHRRSRHALEAPVQLNPTSEPVGSCGHVTLHTVPMNARALHCGLDHRTASQLGMPPRHSSGRSLALSCTTRSRGVLALCAPRQTVRRGMSSGGFGVCRLIPGDDRLCRSLE